jgi:hypothetical protein
MDILWIKSSDRQNLESVFDTYATRESRRRIRRVLINDNWADTLEMKEFQRFLEGCENLETVTIFRWSDSLMDIPGIAPLQSKSLPFSSRFLFKARCQRSIFGRFN